MGGIAHALTHTGGGVAQPSVTFNSTATTQTITGLTTGDAYSVTVVATNAVGTGPESAHSNLVIPGPYAPTVPTILRNATAANQSATVSWLAPASDGGSPIAGYVVTAYVGYGTEYRFWVRAYNAWASAASRQSPTP